jgi:CDP-glucose 4,6-dehydratase
MNRGKQWRDRRVLVTGCTGILGSWLVRDLHRLGADIVGIVRDRVPKSNLILSGYIDNINVVHGSITDFSLVERTITEYEIEFIFHLAAQTIVGTANVSPLSTFESNIRGTYVLLEAARNKRCVRGIVVASSDKAYGEKEDLPYREDDPLRGLYPYDASKACTDLIAQSYHHTFGMPTAIARCGNFYGGGDLNWNRIVPGTIRSLYYDERPVIRSDGTLIRDYFYVLDASRAYIRLAEALEDESLHGEAFNFSNEEHRTALELVEEMIRITGKTDIRPRVLGEAESEIPAQTLSAEKARKLLGWRPEYTLEEGLNETVRWYNAFLDTLDKERKAG